MPRKGDLELNQDQPFLNELLQSNSSSLPLDLPAAVYYRQSTAAQVGNSSTMFQIIDMVDTLVDLGWKRNQIILIDIDAGISATRRIADRPGMSFVLDLIRSRSIGLVAVAHVDRLFRDLTQIDSNTFIDLCQQHNVRVLTPTFLYDFASPVYGRYHQHILRSQAQAAADYLQTYLLDRLYRGRDLLWSAGCWAGGWVPLGYVVDMRKFTLQTGSNANSAKQLNSNWRKFVPFEPYAMVIREYFRLAEYYNCNQHRLWEHLQAHGPYVAAATEVDVPPGFLLKSWLSERAVSTGNRNQHQNHGVPTVKTISSILTNATYIGHWIVRGQVRRSQNHEPIVPLDLFMSVFNRLSPTDLEGRDNPQYLNRSMFYRKSKFKQQARPAAPLYAGVVHMIDSRAPSPRPLLPAQYRWWGYMSRYVYRIKVEVGLDRYREECISAPLVDEIVNSLVDAKLRTLGWLDVQQLDAREGHVLERRSTTERTADQPHPDAGQFSSELADRLTSIRSDQLRTSTSASFTYTKTSVQTRTGYHESSAIALQLPDQFSSSLSLSTSSATLTMAFPVAQPAAISGAALAADPLPLPLPSLPRSLEDTLLRWPNVNPVEQRLVFNALADAIWIERDIARRSRRTITVCWQDGSSTTWQSAATLTGTAESKRRILAWHRQMEEFVMEKTPQMEILKAFPDYTWRQITARYSRSHEHPWTQVYQGEVRYGWNTRWQDIVDGTARLSRKYKPISRAASDQGNFR